MYVLNGADLQEQDAVTAFVFLHFLRLQHADLGGSSVDSGKGGDGRRPAQGDTSRMQRRDLTVLLCPFSLPSTVVLL